jgi:hypothetical protein
LQTLVQLDFLDATLIRATGEWHRSARVCHANYSPGAENVAIGYPHRLTDIVDAV